MKQAIATCNAGEFTVWDSGRKVALERIRLCGETQRTSLDLSDLGLDGFPLELLELNKKTPLTKLDLSRNRFSDLPLSIKEFKKLKYLNISGNKLSALPESLGMFHKLTDLDISNNKIKRLPESFSNLFALKILKAQDNELSVLPDYINKFTLKVFEIHNNPLVSFPEDLTNLTDNGTYKLLGHLEKIFELSEKNGMSDYFFKIAKPHLDYVIQKLHITPLQALIFTYALILGNYSASAASIARQLHCSLIKTVQFRNELHIMEKQKLIKNCGNPVNDPCFSIPDNIISLIHHDKEYSVPDYREMTETEFFDTIEKLFGQHDRTTNYDIFSDEFSIIVQDNRNLDVTRKIRRYDLHKDSLVLLLWLCQLYVYEDIFSIDISDVNSIYVNHENPGQIKRKLKEGSHELFEKGLVERSNDSGFGSTSTFQLTGTTRKALLSTITVQLGKNRKNLICYEKLASKELFYNEKEKAAVRQLTSLLQEENLTLVQERLSAGGMRSGFACLFYGSPGTGKTETVYQIARETRRDIMLVNIAEMKSLWYGESEKLIKKLFDDYKSIASYGGNLPILLFNEADAVIGTRRELSGNNHSVAQTENTIQNIILQEMENLTGILIATTNLTRNLDRAFERRFLYKIEFNKPDATARFAIWRGIIPELSETDSRILAARFDFSGGQIENISRKMAVDNIITGMKPALESVIRLCQDEVLNKDDSGKRIGFVP
jgi:hypothetical protein